MNNEKLLIVVDYQNDFVDGSLGFEKAKDIEEFVINKINEFKNNKDNIIFTLDTHDSSYLASTLEGQKLPIKHCIKGTKGHEIYGKVKGLAKDYLKIEKNAFGSIELGNYLSKNIYKEICLVGLVSNICVFSNAIIARSASPTSKIYVYKEGTTSFDLELEKKCFEVLESLHIEII